jgi:hypothetical protein
MFDKILDAMCEIQLDWFHKLLIATNLVALFCLPLLVERAYELIAVKKYLLSEEYVSHNRDDKYEELKVYDK